jgi:ribosomal protein S18 acetylase RimI-like enzyme
VTEYRLRPAAEADREWAYELKRDAYQEVVERQFGPWNEDWQRNFFMQRWAPSISQIVSVDGTDIGLIAVEERPEEIWLDEIQLSSDWRARGIGTRLLNDVIADCRRRGKALSLQVLRENTRAKDLYERLGLKVVDETPTHYVMRLMNETGC